MKKIYPDRVSLVMRISPAMRIKLHTKALQLSLERGKRVMLNTMILEWIDPHVKNI